MFYDLSFIIVSLSSVQTSAMFVEHHVGIRHQLTADWSEQLSGANWDERFFIPLDGEKP